MRLPLFALLLCFSSSIIEASIPLYNEPVPVNFQLTGGFRQDNLKFEIGPFSRKNDSQFQDVKERNFTQSKVKFRNLKIAQVGATYSYTTHNNYYLRLNADYGRVVDGRGRVSNFRLQHRNFDNGFNDDSSSSFESFSSSSGHRKEYSEQTSQSNNGYVADLLGAVGWKVLTDAGRGWIAGLGGFSCHRQSFELTNFTQTFALNGFVPLGKIAGLKGTYLTSWTGPWLGVDFLTIVEYDVTLSGSLEWHWAKYRASGHWNFPDEYTAHMRHKAQGYGAVARLCIDWTPCDRWAFGVSGNYEIWSTKNKARNRASVNDNIPAWDNITNTFPVVKRSSLRRVRWNTYNISATVVYRY